MKQSKKTAPKKKNEKQPKTIDSAIVFGQNLQNTLNALGITKAKFAKMSGLTRTAVGLIVHGRRDPQLATILKILKAVPVSFDRLAGLENGK